MGDVEWIHLVQDTGVCLSYEHGTETKAD